MADPQKKDTKNKSSQERHDPLISPLHVERASTTVLGSITPIVPLPPPPQTQRMAFRSSDNGDGDDDNNSEKVCRICLEEDHPENMIAPCRCSGSSKWVHRECLDLWRVNEEARAFSKCTECLFPYRLQAVSSNHQRWKRFQFYLFVSRDFFVMALLLQLMIGAVGALVWACDRRNHELVRLFAGECLAGNADSFWCNHTLSIYYMCGVLILLIALGCFGSTILCTTGCSVERSLARVVGDGGGDEDEQQQQQHPEHRARVYRQHRRQRRQHRTTYCCCCDDACCYPCYVGHPYPYNGYYYRGDCSGCCCECGDCTLPHHSGGGDGDGAAILLAILLVVAIVLAIIGFIVGVVLAVVTFQRIVQRHVFLLQKRRLVEEFVVMDLSGYEGDLETAAAAAAAVATVDGHHDLAQDSPLLPPPLAPPSELDDSDKAHLQKLGLMDKPSCV